MWLFWVGFVGRLFWVGFDWSELFILLVIMVGG